MRMRTVRLRSGKPPVIRIASRGFASRFGGLLLLAFGMLIPAPAAERHVVLIDTSGSMAEEVPGEKFSYIHLAEAMLQKLLEKPPEDWTLRLAAFDSREHPSVEVDPQKPATLEEARALTRKLASWVGDGRTTHLWTTVDKELEKLVAYARAHPGEPCILHALTDGLDTEKVLTLDGLLGRLPELTSRALVSDYPFSGQQKLPGSVHLTVQVPAIPPVAAIIPSTAPPLSDATPGSQASARWAALLALGAQGAQPTASPSQTPAPTPAANKGTELERSVEQLRNEIGLREEVSRLRRELDKRSGLTTTLDVAALVGAIAWPVLLVVAALLFRDQLVEVAKVLAPRVRSFSVGVVSLEFAEAQPLSLQMTGAVDLRHAGDSSDVSDSTLRSFYEQIRDPSRLDYAFVDLGDGHEWLTSRLYILSVILARMRGLRALVFVETAAHVRRRYIGVAECDKVRWRLAMRFPWLESALAHAEAAVWSKPVQRMKDYQNTPNVPVVSNDQGRLIWQHPGQPVLPGGDPEPAAEILRRFLDKIQLLIAPPGDDEWESLPSTPPKSGRFERARWLKPADLQQIMGPVLDHSAVSIAELQRSDEATKARILVSQASSWVALTRDDCVFDRLVNRTSIIETIARKCAQ